MTDLRDRLDRLVDSEVFEPLDTGAAIAQGRRTVRRRRITATVGGAAAAVVGVLATMTGVQHVTQPDVDFGDPGGRKPAASGVPADVAYPDLVTSRTGSSYVSITGFGWPLAEMDPDDIDKLDAESMCLPMLEQAAPEVPASAWQHSEAWVDSFPSRATLPTTIEAEHEGVQYDARCTLPGEFVPQSRPFLEQPPSERDHAAISKQCSYLGHVDFAGWQVVAAQTPGATVAALRSPDGHVATCVLSATPAGRMVQLSQRVEPPTADDVLLFHRAGRSVMVAGLAPAGATSVELRVTGSTSTGSVVNGLFAVAGTRPEEAGLVVQMTAYDGARNELARYSTKAFASGSAGRLDPADCFYGVEMGDDGC